MVNLTLNQVKKNQKSKRNHKVTENSFKITKWWSLQIIYNFIYYLTAYSKISSTLRGHQQVEVNLVKPGQKRSDQWHWFSVRLLDWPRQDFETFFKHSKWFSFRLYSLEKIWLENTLVSVLLEVIWQSMTLVAWSQNKP